MMRLHEYVSHKPVRTKAKWVPAAFVDTSRLLGTYRISDGRHAAVDEQLHPIHEARVV
jgi:hypothetical protein